VRLRVLFKTHINNPLEYWIKHPAECELNLIQGSKPCRTSLYGARQEDHKEMAEQIEELLKKGLIRPSKSPFACPAFQVRNKAEKERKRARLVVDYKPLNEITIRDSYPLPNKDQLIKRIYGCKWFSKFDCFNGFW
jgi:hypothetical protein